MSHCLKIIIITIISTISISSIITIIIIVMINNNSNNNITIQIYNVLQIYYSQKPPSYQIIIMICITLFENTVHLRFKSSRNFHSLSKVSL